jgi:hypothetical protein
MAARRKTLANVWWLLGWGLVATVIWFRWSPLQSRDISNEKTKINSSMQEELSLKEQDLRLKSREAAESRKAEFEKALGGNVEAAFKHPDYSLRQALQLAALACAPTNAAVFVEVERFTEFSVNIATAQAISTNAMAAIARKFLPLAKPYLEALRFSVNGSVVAELDREDIAFIDDWSRASDERIAMLLPREIPAATQDAGAVERWKEQREIGELLNNQPGLAQKLEAAEREFSDQIRQSYEDLNAAINLSSEAISFGDQGKFDAAPRLAKLETAKQRGKKAREFWTDPAARMRTILEARGIAGESLNTLAKSTMSFLRHDPAKAKKVFESLDGKIESSRYFLSIAQEQAEGWKFDPHTGQFGFSNEDFSRRFRRAQEQVRADGEALEAALRAWNEAIAP